MTERDRWLAGYATGTLSEEERRALFAAAMEDQELFNALGDEDALRELLAQPGVKTRLAAVLEASAPQRSRGKTWAWPAAALAASVVVGIALFLPEHEAPVEFAKAPEPKRPAETAPAPPARREQPGPARGTPAAAARPAAAALRDTAPQERSKREPPLPEPVRAEARQANARLRGDAAGSGVVGGTLGGAPSATPPPPPAAPPAAMGFRSAPLAVHWRWEWQPPDNSASQPLAPGEQVPPGSRLRLVITSPGGGTLLLRRGADTLVPLHSVVGPSGTTEARYAVTAEKPETLRLDLLETGRRMQFEIPVPVATNR